jgi:hypothetical protein
MEQNPQATNILEELKFANDKILIGAKRIDHNILYQILLLFLGILFCANPVILKDSDLPLAKSGPLMMIIIPALLMYFFMRFGYSFYHYYTLRRDIDLKIKMAYPQPERWHYRIFTNESIAESIYIFLKKKNPSFNEMHYALDIKKRKISFSSTVAYTYMLIFSINHSLSMFFVYRYSPSSFMKLFFGFLVAGIITLCYRDYYLLKEDFPKFRNTWILNYSISIIAFAAFYYFIPA